MNRPRSVVESLAFVLRRVVGEQLRRSFNGQEIWRDDHTWRELAGGVSRAFSAYYVIIDKAEYRKLVADASQMRTIRGYIDEFHRRLPKDQRKKETRKSLYARWAEEHMKPKEGT